MLLYQTTQAQDPYSSENVHAHNDYEQQVPFFSAHQKQVGSIEVDVFLRQGKLYVAHEAEEIQPHLTLRALYLNPLREEIRKNSGNPYNRPNAKLQLLIDLKTEGKHTLPVLESLLEEYPEISRNKDILIVISGSKPNPASWSHFSKFIYFDGTPGKKYTEEQLQRIALFSDSFKNYTTWDGKGKIAKANYRNIKQVIKSVHRLDKKFRFWATADTVTVWQFLTELGVDYLGTDDVQGLTRYLNDVYEHKR